MPSKVKGQSYLLRKSVVHLHYLFLLRLSVLNLDPKKAKYIHFHLSESIPYVVFYGGGNLLINF